MSECNEHLIRIYGLPKTLSRYKLRCLLQRHLGAGPWHIQQLIPLEQWCLADIVCGTSASCESFLRMNAAPIPSFAACPTFQVTKISNSYAQNPSTDTRPHDASSSQLSLLDLNCDCLRLVLAQCSLSTQITLAKVCQQLQSLIEDIWRQRYVTLHFSLYHFKVVHKLTDAELWDFCSTVGVHVRRLIFNSALFLAVLQQCIVHVMGNMMQNAKRYINVHLCRHLPHFELLLDCQVQGKFLADYTVRELARYCKQLRRFELLDPGTSWLLGKHLHRLARLEVLSLQDCECLQRRRMHKICGALPLHSLNVVECKQLLHASVMQRLCHRLTHVETLQLTALASASMLRCILQLPRLRHLQFYWYNDFVEFERLLHAQLLQDARATLCSLHYANELSYADNASQRVWRAGEYATLRELVALNGRPWQWHEPFPALLQCSAQFARLERFTFEYCRLGTPAQLLELAHACKSLRRIKLIGCRAAEDDKLLADWRQSAAAACELCIVGELSWSAVQALRERELPFRKEPNRQPIFRSIECRFN